MGGKRRLNRLIPQRVSTDHCHSRLLQATGTISGTRRKGITIGTAQQSSVLRALSLSLGQQDAREEKRACADVVAFAGKHSVYLLRVLDGLDPLPIGKQHIRVFGCLHLILSPVVLCLPIA